MADRSVDFLLIGGGIAAGNCARWLRESGADGSILLVGREPDLPYERPSCSKGYLMDRESRQDALFRPSDWWEQQEIEVMTKVSATTLDPSGHTVKLSNGDEVAFGQALIATGANVRRLPVPGAELEGIHYLRTLGNSDAIHQDAAGKRVVMVGGSYIASEVAASLTELGSTCTMVMLEHLVLSGGFGEQAGRFFQERLEEHGISIHGDDELDRFEGRDGRVTHVVTKRGLELETDAVVIGAGVIPDVMLARRAGLQLGERGGVLTNSRLQSSAPAIYAAGDIAEYDSIVHGRHVRIEHWDVALNHGRTVALNMLGRQQPHDVVPYFFSDLSDWVSLEYVGPAFRWDREVVRGSTEDGQFAIFYLNERRLAGALSVGRPEDLEHARRLIRSGTEISRVEALADHSADLGEF